MGRGSTVAFAAAVALRMLLVLPPDADTYEQESRRMFEEWKASHRTRSAYKSAGEEECRYAVFKETCCRVAWARAADRWTSSGLNGFAATTIEEFNRRLMFRRDGAYEEETRGVFVGWKAKYGKTYRDAGEEKCRYMLFKGNRRIVVRLNADAGEHVYGINQFGDLTNEEVRESCYPEMVDQELSARCQAAAAPNPDPSHGRWIWYQVCRCIATEAESTGSAVPGDEVHIRI